MQYSLQVHIFRDQTTLSEYYDDYRSEPARPSTRSTTRIAASPFRPPESPRGPGVRQDGMSRLGGRSETRKLFPSSSRSRSGSRRRYDQRFQRPRDKRSPTKGREWSDKPSTDTTDSSPSPLHSASRPSKPRRSKTLNVYCTEDKVGTRTLPTIKVTIENKDEENNQRSVMPYSPIVEHKTNIVEVTTGADPKSSKISEHAAPVNKPELNATVPVEIIPKSSSVVPVSVSVTKESSPPPEILEIETSRELREGLIGEPTGEPGSGTSSSGSSEKRTIVMLDSSGDSVDRVSSHSSIEIISPVKRVQRDSPRRSRSVSRKIRPVERQLSPKDRTSPGKSPSSENRPFPENRFSPVKVSSPKNRSLSEKHTSPEKRPSPQAKKRKAEESPRAGKRREGPVESPRGGKKRERAEASPRGGKRREGTVKSPRGGRKREGAEASPRGGKQRKGRAKTTLHREDR